MKVKSKKEDKEKDLYQIFYDILKELFCIEDDDEKEIEKVIIYTDDENRYVLEFKDDD